MARRMGGRTARHAMRGAPPKDEDKAVRPGTSGDCFKPLTDAEVLRVHEAALHVLESIGLSQAIPSCIELVTKAGGKLSSDGRLLFPRSLVEDTVANAPRVRRNSTAKPPSTFRACRSATRNLRARR